MENALLAAICAQPDDISARLVYADYLLEQPEPEKRERGEFILAQCRRAAGGLSANEDADLRTRDKALLEKYREPWVLSLRGLVSNAAFSRGFPDRVTMTVDRFADRFAEVSRETPVARLHLTGAYTVLTEIAEFEQLRGVVGLDLSGEHVSSVGLREFLASPHLTRLTYLNLGNNDLNDAGADVLAESPVLKRLHFLSVARCGLTPSGVSRLLSRITTDAPGLRWLNLRGNPLSPGNWAEVVLTWLPSRMHPALRLSLEGQLGRYRVTKPEPDPGPLPRLKAASAKLSPDFAGWVKALDISKPAQLVAAIGTNLLPADVHQAFAAVCGRRYEWVCRRVDAGVAVEKLPAATGPKGLAELVREVLCVTLQTPTDDALWLRDWLLRLFELHAAGTLDPQGRTR